MDCLPLTPVSCMMFLIKSLKLSKLKFLVISIVLHLKSYKKLLNLVRLYFPQPPTPINIIFPLGCLKTLAILRIC